MASGFGGRAKIRIGRVQDVTRVQYPSEVIFRRNSRFAPMLKPNETQLSAAVGLSLGDAEKTQTQCKCAEFIRRLPRGIGAALVLGWQKDCRAIQERCPPPVKTLRLSVQFAPESENSRSRVGRVASRWKQAI